jgi:uncharacterized protein
MRNLLFAILMLLSVPVISEELLPIPLMNGSYIIDQSGVLTEEDLKELNSKISTIDKTKGTAVIGILIIPTTNGEPIDQFSMRVSEAWSLGHSYTEDGVVVTLVTDDKNARIEIGRGLSGDLTDLVTRGLLLESLKDFKESHYRIGLSKIIQGVDTLVKMPVAIVPPVSSINWVPIIILVGLLLLIVSLFGLYWWITDRRDQKKRERDVGGIGRETQR